MTEIKKVAVLGAGLMGHGLVQIFARHGCEVILTSRRPEGAAEAKTKIRADLETMAEGRLVRREDIDSILDRIHGTTEMEEVADCGFVLESVVENLSIKQDLFKKLDEMCPPETILATNTSVISITEIAAKSKNRSRIVGTHFWNPPFLIPLVEVVKGADTSNETMQRTIDFLNAAGKHPIWVEKDVPGFVCNRLQHALWREAVSIVERGIAEPSVVDEAIKFGFGIRLPVLAPLETADMVGLDLTKSIHDYVLKHLEDSHTSSPILTEKVEKGELGFKTGGVGFQTWTPEEQKALRKRLMDHLMKWNREQAGIE